MRGKLYIVPTPIGNLSDITLRALEVLREVDEIIAEDTRQTKKLLRHYEIAVKMSSFHKFNEHGTTPHIVDKLKNGKQVALVSDGGMPLLSDPGYPLIQSCIEAKIGIETLPGATAFLPAIVNSGFPMNQFVFEGFLPHKKGRKKRLENIKNEYRTMVFYESPYRLIKLIHEFIELFGEERKISVSREISKKFEETIRGSLREVLHHFEQKKPKGEIVVVLEAMKDHSEK